MIPATYNWSIVRGTTAPFVVRLQGGDPLVAIPFDDVRLSISNLSGSTEILRVTISNGRMIVTDPATSEVAWIPEPEESRKIPKGAKSSYELEVWNGESQLVYIMGTITGIGGINDDDEDVS